MTKDIEKTDEQSGTEQEVEALETTKETLDKSVQGEKDSEIKFTQKDIDKAVEDRLARERSSTKRKVTAAETSLKNAELTIENYEKILSKQVEAMTKDLPESVTVLLSKLTVSEQLDWLADSSNQITQRTKSPKTPLPRHTDNKDAPSEVRKII